jgi:ABC-type Fe3+-hydroxamate transport system substrate-binding protein
MRNLLILGLLAVVAVAAGCSSNSPTGNMTGWTNQIAPVNGSLTPPPPPVVVPVGAVYGTVSNLNLAAGTFTLTSPSGEVVNVVLSPTTKVLYQGSATEFSSSNLADGETVTVTGTVIGLPSQAKVRAAMVVINSSLSNTDIIKGGTE